MISPHYWNSFSKKLKNRILVPRYMGELTKQQIQSEEMRLVIHEEGQHNNGYWIKFFVVIDETDGVIADITYVFFGDSLLVGALEFLCDLVIRKNYDQAARIQADHIEKEAKDGEKGFPSTASIFLNIVLSALDGIIEQCQDIPFASSYVPPSPFSHLDGVTHEYPSFGELSKEQKIVILQQVINEDVKPYVELDAGGVEIGHVEGFFVTIKYQGNCSSCFSSIGSTLSSIQHILRVKIHPDIVVEADPTTLTFSGAHEHPHVHL